MEQKLLAEEVKRKIDAERTRERKQAEKERQEEEKIKAQEPFLHFFKTSLLRFEISKTLDSSKKGCRTVPHLMCAT